MFFTLTELKARGFVRPPLADEAPAMAMSGKPMPHPWFWTDDYKDAVDTAILNMLRQRWKTAREQIERGEGGILMDLASWTRAVKGH